MNNTIAFSNWNFLSLFQNFSLAIKSKTLTSIAGPNNCGKTTLLRALCGQKKMQEDITVLGKKQSTYKITDYSRIVRGVFPLEYTPILETVEEELNYATDKLFLRKTEKSKRLREIYKNLSLNKLKKSLIKDLTEEEFIRLQLALTIAEMPKIMVIDDISVYIGKEEMKKIVEYFKELIKEYGITIVMTTSRLDDTMSSDELVILSENQVVLQDKPLDVLQKDNILNKVGLQVPFMIDLSVKLKDYNLIDNIELDMDRMVDILWK